MNWERFAVIRTAILVIAGFACLSLAAFLFHIIAGLVVTGVLLLLLEFLTQPTTAAVRRA